MAARTGRKVAGPEDVIEQLERARERVRLVQEALGALQKDRVWFAVDARLYRQNPPIIVGECRLAGRESLEVSAEGLDRCLRETEQAMVAAVKTLGGRPAGGARKSAGTRKRARK